MVIEAAMKDSKKKKNPNRFFLQFACALTAQDQGLHKGCSVAGWHGIVTFEEGQVNSESTDGRPVPSAHNPVSCFVVSHYTDEWSSEPRVGRHCLCLLKC